MNGIRRQERSFYGRVRLDQLVRSTKGDKVVERLRKVIPRRGLD